MKRIVLLALMVLSVVGCYDDAALWDQIMDHESRLVKLEALCNQMNTNIQSLQAIVTALQNNDYVTNVAPIKENGKDIGYTISFSKSGSVTIYHGVDGKDGSNGKDGADGKDGHTPVIGIRQDSDGVWYWTLDGDWLMNDAGAKIPTTGADGKDGVNGTDGKDGADGKDGEDGADGKDGVTPQLKIEECYWYISYDNGLSWVKLDKAVGEDGKDGTDGVDGKDGDSFFKSVTQDDDSVYLTLSDGTEFVLPKKSQSCTLVLDKSIVLCEPGKTVTVGYVLQFDREGGVPVVTTMSEGGYNTKVQKVNEDIETGTVIGNIIVSAGPVPASGRVMVFVHNQGEQIAMEYIEIGCGFDFTDLESANSYIVSAPGFYVFAAVRGNSLQTIEDISSVEVLWESFGTDEAPAAGDLIQNAEYENGVITFRTADEFKEGNAVIAAKDANGTILWSWHIWLTDQPEEQVYFNGAGTMMDRNLGAISATPGDVGTLGLMYQWGRKDPFLGAMSVSSKMYAESTSDWPPIVDSDSSTGTIEYSTANPMTLIYSATGDWCYSESGFTDSSRWTTSDKLKSVYDPCPSGWRVPDGGENGVWAKAVGATTSSFSDYLYADLYDNSDTGMDLSGKLCSAGTIWYPLTGNISKTRGIDYENNVYCYYLYLTGVGRLAYYLSASLDENRTVYCLSIDVYGVRTSTKRSPCYANSVRCVKEGSQSSDASVSLSNELDLSKDGVANSYIVSGRGLYKFTPAKGNSLESVGSIASAETLWETFGTDVAPSAGDLIDDVRYEDGFIKFNVSDAFKEGNAVIAAKDANGAILWSWHIWLTDQPEGQTYFRNAGTMMDRNLGATSATPGDVGALGLLYQPGRKDPFLGSSSISEAVEAKSTILWPSSADDYTLEYSTANPTTFISGYNYYMGNWSSSGTKKSVYDPCPVGWRVPGTDVWQKPLNYMTADYTVNRDQPNYGWNLSGILGKSASIWYPSTGYKSSDGSLGWVGTYGRCWAADEYCDTICMFYVGSTSCEVLHNMSGWGSAGVSVRCVQE